MRKVFKHILVLGTVVYSLASCDLNRNPISGFSELTVGQKTDTSSVKYATRAEMLAQYQSMYNSITNSQEGWYLDFLVYTETHADNAYCGTSGSELTSLEQQTQDGTNKNIERDWNSFLGQITTANRIICNIDSVPDPALTSAERVQWKAEARIWRAWMLFDMVRLWGDVPVVTQETPDITSDNIEQIYPLLYPSRQPVAKVYEQIIADLTEGEKNAPNIDAVNKFVLSKTVARALLAKVYAEKPMRDYAKVIDYCSKVQADGLSLVAYTDLFAVNAAKTDCKLRNSAESIFEIVYPQGSGNWVTWMFGIDLCDPSSTYNWAKWITPSRDLIKAFDNEGDAIRENEAIVWGQPSWSNHYPSSHYPFMYKTRSKYNSIIKLRLADILLLKAEAYVEQNSLAEAAALVDQIRSRVNLSGLSSTTKASPDLMREAVLKERRLELAFEGQRWFDLLRTGKVFNVMNTLNARDAGRAKMATVNDKNILLPVPQTQLDKNPSLTQNEGY
ncbi:RagB/SusD family nutrient uptake outer membrane protein [Parabacteroides sp. FAFU027]|uniref:RagB/SusD family nutrient uptake outer membrane protein n=1 Tax=Parabacteroides sp. FAFU027 TaxID=2922715 RepID=UPI001FAF4669|nr:RagB/SusD family nutrient uptake outer membrane protein [Parabacteroides sp. FAFU027]